MIQRYPAGFTVTTDNLDDYGAPETSEGRLRVVTGAESIRYVRYYMGMHNGSATATNLAELVELEVYGASHDGESGDIWNILILKFTKKSNSLLCFSDYQLDFI